MKHAPLCLNYLCTCGAKEKLLEAITPFSGSNDPLDRAKASEVVARFDGLMDGSVPQVNNEHEAGGLGA